MTQASQFISHLQPRQNHYYYIEMEYIKRLFIDRQFITVSTVVIVGFCTIKLIASAAQTVFQKLFADLDNRPEHYEKGVIYVHTFLNSTVRQLLNLSPYGIKLESWLRLHKIPYKTIQTLKMSSKTGQIPYIVLDGEEIADSNKIIKFLAKKFNIPEDEGLDEEHQAISHSLLRTVDESLSWTYFTLRYMHYGNFYGKYFKLPLPSFFEKLAYRDMKKKITRRMVLHGMGRKSIPDIAEVAQDDILAISKYLGKKKFLFGDSITKADCAVFAHLSQFIYVTLEYPHQEALAESPNILPYMERIKNQLWPDWDDLVNMELFE